jgi:uncharacterized membrane protein
VTAAGSAEEQARQERIQALLARPSSSGTMRFVVSVALGLVACVAFSLLAAPRYGVLAGLMVIAGAYVGWTYAAVRRFHGQGTWAHASQEDPNGFVRDVGIAMVIVGNLGAVVALLVLDHGKGHGVAAGLALGSVVLSWFLLHSLYVPHYTRLFYGEPGTGEPGLDLVVPGSGQVVHVAGGVDFNRDGYWPAYADFTYFAFNLGMTFQVSDTSVSSPTFRRLVLGHSLLSYFFATAITATVVNLVVGLVS